MGAGGAGLILILVPLMVVIVLVGTLLLVIAWNTRGDKHSRTTAIIGGVLIGTVVLPVAGALFFGAIAGVFLNDPKTLVVDLRSPANASELGGTPFEGSDTIREFTSENIDLTLPDGSTFTAHDVTISVHTDTSDRIEFVSINRRLTEPWGDAVDTLRDWSHDLGVAVQTPTRHDVQWEQSAESGGAVVDLRLYPTSAGNGTVYLTVRLDR
ncbi:hypothetical protein nbrc107696_17960 [Gordonia spumicola]|uniref:Uncharacterized protein n=1 Tax=Gordonia spumicola TaxID=589161 RepID=A0A7I9V8C7_9ACTN|nr:hypothetical protein [Gordonia spumicola]GEE01350.1 hypothetical protein nbrc107696_17960 [Gordonia spumicola]